MSFFSDFVAEFRSEFARRQQVTALEKTLPVKSKLVRLELQGVKVRAVPDDNGRTFLDPLWIDTRDAQGNPIPDENGRTQTDPEWIPTHEPIEDLGTLALADLRPWHQRAWDRIRGKGGTIGRITVGA